MRPDVGVIGGIRGHVGRPVSPAGLVGGPELRRALIDSHGGGVGYAAGAVGVGKFGTPWARTHCENLSACAFTCCTWAAVGPLPPFGSRCRQAPWPACTREVLAPSCCGVSFDLSNAPLLSGSGQFGIPLERMQRAKATAPFCGAGAATTSCRRAATRRGQQGEPAGGRERGHGAGDAHGRPSAFRAALSQATSVVWNRRDFVSIPVPSNLVPLPWLEGLGPDGSGYVGNPCVRMQRAAFRAKSSFTWSPRVPARPAAREQVLAQLVGCQHRLLRHAESPQGRRGDVPVRVGIREARHAVRPHAARERERRAHLRRPGRGRGREAVRRRGRRGAELGRRCVPGDPPQATASAATAAVATIAAKRRMRSMIARPDNSPRSRR